MLTVTSARNKQTLCCDTLQSGVSSLLNRRRFLMSITAAATTTTLQAASARPLLGALRADPQRLLDVPEGFRVDVVSRAGDVMADGLAVPPAHDGMAAFTGRDGRVVLVSNHEMESAYPEYSAFGTRFATLPDTVRERVYDWGGSETPGAGGTTTTIYDPAARRTERQFLSLAGTELNCSGGRTPWGSWLSCEETFTDPGTSFTGGKRIVRNEKHGYVFEVLADADGLVQAEPLRALGRFEHEAAAVHPASGAVYLTEDRHHGLFYRFLPAVPGKLAEGGRLQALSVAGRLSARTHNWSNEPDMRPGERLPVRWLDLEDVDPVMNDLRLRGAMAGAATFARGEGLCWTGEALVFTCTVGGFARLGQVFSYAPSAHEGTGRESDEPGYLELIAEAHEDSLLRNADNLTMAPWGDLIVCEDALSHSGLVGIRPDGAQYPIADNTYSGSELAGVCFAPDGKTLFVNIQYPGMTVAISGPWPT
jgi:secreted PhoX family phosphatase